MTEICIVFDLDDTLYPEQQYVLSGFRAVAAWLADSHGIDQDEAESCMCSTFQDGRRGDIFNNALERLGIAYDGALIRKLVGIYRGHVPAITLFDDACWALDHYAELPLGLITDGYLVAQKAKVTALAIAGRFSSLIYTDALGQQYWKPHERAFELTERAVREAHNFIYVADNEAKDFIAPRRRGWITVMIERPEAEYSAATENLLARPQHRISTLRDLPTVLGI